MKVAAGTSKTLRLVRLPRGSKLHMVAMSDTTTTLCGENARRMEVVRVVDTSKHRPCFDCEAIETQMIEEEKAAEAARLEDRKAAESAVPAPAPSVTPIKWKPNQPAPKTATAPITGERAEESKPRLQLDTETLVANSDISPMFRLIRRPNSSVVHLQAHENHWNTAICDAEATGAREIASAPSHQLCPKCVAINKEVAAKDAAKAKINERLDEFVAKAFPVSNPAAATDDGWSTPPVGAYVVHKSVDTILGKLNASIEDYKGGGFCNARVWSFRSPRDITKRFTGEDRIAAAKAWAEEKLNALKLD